jgi:hypothetical protein
MASAAESNSYSNGDAGEAWALLTTSPVAPRGDRVLPQSDPVSEGAVACAPPATAPSYCELEDRGQSNRYAPRA